MVVLFMVKENAVLLNVPIHFLYRERSVFCLSVEGLYRSFIFLLSDRLGKEVEERTHLSTRERAGVSGHNVGDKKSNSYGINSWNISLKERAVYQQFCPGCVDS